MVCSIPQKKVTVKSVKTVPRRSGLAKSKHHAHLSSSASASHYGRHTRHSMSPPRRNLTSRERHVRGPAACYVLERMGDFASAQHPHHTLSPLHHAFGLSRKPPHSPVRTVAVVRWRTHAQMRHTKLRRSPRLRNKTAHALGSSGNTSSNHSNKRRRGTADKDSPHAITAAAAATATTTAGAALRPTKRPRSRGSRSRSRSRSSRSGLFKSRTSAALAARIIQSTPLKPSRGGIVESTPLKKLASSSSSSSHVQPRSRLFPLPGGFAAGATSGHPNPAASAPSSLVLESPMKGGQAAQPQSQSQSHPHSTTAVSVGTSIASRLVSRTLRMQDVSGAGTGAGAGAPPSSSAAPGAVTPPRRRRARGRHARAWSGGTDIEAGSPGAGVASSVGGGDHVAGNGFPSSPTGTASPLAGGVPPSPATSHHSAHSTPRRSARLARSGGRSEVGSPSPGRRRSARFKRALVFHPQQQQQQQ